MPNIPLLFDGQVIAWLPRDHLFSRRYPNHEHARMKHRDLIDHWRRDERLHKTVSLYRGLCTEVKGVRLSLAPAKVKKAQAQ